MSNEENQSSPLAGILVIAIHIVIGCAMYLWGLRNGEQVGVQSMENTAVRHGYGSIVVKDDERKFQWHLPKCEAKK